MSTRQAKNHSISRRQFLKRASAAVGAISFPYIVSSSALSRGKLPAPSERITIGMIGTGNQGTGHLRGLLPMPETQIVAVCDPFRNKRENAAQIVNAAYSNQKARGRFTGCSAYNDFRELLARPDIDAVFIASPENWHALQGVAAAKAGKDIYLEKAMAVTIAEGQALVKAVNRYGRILQVGTQQRSDARFRKACELVRNGYIGKLLSITTGVWGGYQGPIAKPAPVPEGLDWRMWLGPAPWKPYAPQRVHNLTGWMLASDYCIGFQAGWGAHHNDIAVWGMGTEHTGPIKIEGRGIFPKEGMNDTPISWHTEYLFADGLRWTFTSNDKNPVGIRFEGTDGWVFVNRSLIDTHPKSLLTTELGPNDIRLYHSNNHKQDFLDCVKTCSEPICPVEAGHYTNNICILSDISVRLGRKLKWDPAREIFINDKQANHMLTRTMRGRWHL